MAPAGPLAALLPLEGCGETGCCLTPSDGHQIIKDVCVPCPASGPGLFSVGPWRGKGGSLEMVWMCEPSPRIDLK